MNLTNPYEAFKEQMRQNAADKRAEAQRQANDRLEQARRRLEQLMQEELFKNLYGDTFSRGWSYQPGATWSHTTATKPTTTPGWCKVLDLPATATQDEIKSKYRTLVKQHHPDKGGNPETFNKITRAYNEALLRRPNG